MNNLRSARRMAGMSQAEAAQHLGITQTGFSAWERGPLSVGPDLATAFNRMDSSERIARIINIAKSVGELSDLPDYEIARLFE